MLKKDYFFDFEISDTTCRQQKKINPSFKLKIKYIVLPSSGIKDEMTFSMTFYCFFPFKLGMRLPISKCLALMAAVPFSPNCSFHFPKGRLYFLASA